MDIQGIVEQLRQEASRIERAIAALVGLGSQPAHPRRRKMSAAARARIAAAKKAWWAKRKGKSAPKRPKAVSKKSTVRKPMSAAMRKELSAMMKARWAEKKKAA